MHATYRPDNPVILYLPYYRRVLVRTAATWLLLRLFLENGARAVETAQRFRPLAFLDEGHSLGPLATLGLIGFVLALDAVNARAMRETLFRANAGVATRSVLLLVAGMLLALELAFRALT